MIKAQQKPIDEIRGMLGSAKKVLVFGCGTCVTICFAGGEKEVSILSSLLRMAEDIDNGDRQFREHTVKRQCEWEFLDQAADEAKDADLIISLACGIGVQATAQRFPDKTVVPGVNTAFLGLILEQGVWSERCVACGDCVLSTTGGICPIVRCSKSLLNGPCGGSVNGKCEISPDVECAWQLIVDKLTAFGREDELEQIAPPKDWRTSQSGGPRKIVREDLRI
ncbi:MAG: methylenetetrahydrofolate reductase C-terminal domain-containing protein [Dehalococcoidia bacterium]|nr:methylenetetrahydrofolate reductase C-terminal domain-containing protein [Dehalococcoidia bacterium]